MKNDPINDLFQKLENDFNGETPNEGHANRFLEKLQQQHLVAEHQPRKVTFWKPLLAVAATIVICVAIFTSSNMQTQETMDLASVSPELSETQNFFLGAIELELASLEAQRSPETEAMIEDAMKELRILEKEYEALKIDLTESGNDKRVVYAMITNFQNRISVLQTVLDHIEEVKNFKYQQNENTTTI
ncbi:hypothetical protein ACU8DI_07150 [Psychroserpens sp. BH13MA-6]